MSIFVLGFVAGGVVIPLVLRNNKKIAAWFYKSADWIEVKIEEKTGKNI